MNFFFFKRLKLNIFHFCKFPHLHYCQMSVSLACSTLTRGSAQKSGLNSSSVFCFNFHTAVPVMLFTDKLFTYETHFGRGKFLNFFKVAKINHLHEIKIPIFAKLFYAVIIFQLNLKSSKSGHRLMLHNMWWIGEGALKAVIMRQ